MGYYSSSNKLNAIDLEIDEMFRKYCPNPVYVTLDIHNQIGDVPAKAYMTEEIIDRVSVWTSSDCRVVAKENACSNS